MPLTEAQIILSIVSILSACTIIGIVLLVHVYSTEIINLKPMSIRRLGSYDLNRFFALRWLRVNALFPLFILLFVSTAWLIAAFVRPP